MEFLFPQSLVVIAEIRSLHAGKYSSLLISALLLCLASKNGGKKV
jgi:hypothetical protein